MAQLNSALDYGSRGYWFESSRGHKIQKRKGEILPLKWLSISPFAIYEKFKPFLCMLRIQKKIPKLLNEF